MDSQIAGINANVPTLQQPSSSFSVDPNAPFLGGGVSEHSSSVSPTPPLTRVPSTAVRSGKTSAFAGGFAAMVRRAMSNRRRQQHPQIDPYPQHQQWPLNNADPQPGYFPVPQQSPPRPASPGHGSTHSRAPSQHAPSLTPSRAQSTKAPSIAQLQHSLHTMSPPDPQHQQYHPGQPQAIQDLFYQPIQPLSPVAHSHRTGASAVGPPRVLSPTPSHPRSSRHSRAASLQAPSHHSRMTPVSVPAASMTPGPAPAVVPPPPTSPVPSQAHSHAPSASGQARSHRTRSRRSTVSSQTTVPPSGAATPVPPPEDDIDGTTAADHQTQPAGLTPIQQQQQQAMMDGQQPLPPPNNEIILAEPVYHSPELASDYAKMSSRGSMRSVGSVLDKFKQFLREINELPWVADRVTVDYVPGTSRRRRASVQGLGLRSSRNGGRGSWYDDGRGGDVESQYYGAEESKRSIRPPNNRKKSGDKSLKKMSIDGSSGDGHSAYRNAPTSATHGHGPPPLQTGQEYDHTHGLVTGAGGEAPVGPAGLSAATIEYLRTHRPTQYAGIMYVHDNPGYTGLPPPTPRAPTAAPVAAGTPAQTAPPPAIQTTPGPRPQGVQLHDPPVQRSPQAQVQIQSPTNPGAATPLSALSPISTRSAAIGAHPQAQRQTPTATVPPDGLRTFPTGYVPAHRERDATAGFGEGETHHFNRGMGVPGVAPSA